LLLNIVTDSDPILIALRLNEQTIRSIAFTFRW
jgi:hypothetical protein